MTIGEKWIGKTREGKSRDLIEVQPRNLPKETEKTHEKSMSQISGVPAETELSTS
jgi:hypothetical protein